MGKAAIPFLLSLVLFFAQFAFQEPWKRYAWIGVSLFLVLTAGLLLLDVDDRRVSYARRLRWWRQRRRFEADVRWHVSCTAWGRGASVAVAADPRDEPDPERAFLCEVYAPSGVYGHDTLEAAQTMGTMSGADPLPQVQMLTLFAKFPADFTPRYGAPQLEENDLTHGRYWALIFAWRYTSPSYIAGVKPVYLGRAYFDVGPVNPSGGVTKRRRWWSP